MLESVDAGRVAQTVNTAVMPPNRFEIVEGKSIILGADVPHGCEPVGWTRDGHIIGGQSNATEQPRFRTFERLLNGEASADYDCFLARQLPGSGHLHSATASVRAYLAIDSTSVKDTGSYELLVRAKSTHPTTACLSVAVVAIRVLPAASSSASDPKKRKVSADGGDSHAGDTLSSELPTVHYPHPMAPVFVRALPDKVYIDAGDTVQLGCRLWGLPNNFVKWTNSGTSSPNLLLKKATVA